MRVKMVLPALTEATSPLFRPIKYSLFPPLGLATLAGFLPGDVDVTIEDEHVERLDLDDEPDLVVIQAYITSARRSYEIADHYRRRGVHVVIGGLHPSSLPDEAARHADTVFIGPGEDTWPQFLDDLAAGRPAERYQSTVRTLHGLPAVRRDLIKRHLYLVPNSIVVSRGCPHSCDFCYVDAFFDGGRSFYTQTVDAALTEIERLPGRHLYFLDDHLFGNPRFARALFEGMTGMGRLWQAAGTVKSVLQPGLLEAAVESGLRSLFVGFETISPANLRQHDKRQNLDRDYGAAVRRLHDLGVMVNGSFVFGMDEDDPTVFDRTVDWAVRHGIETATFHVLTPYPGTGLHRRMEAQGRLLHQDWDRYDTRHAVFRPARMTPDQLEEGYWGAYRDFYSWRNIARGAATKSTWLGRTRHLAYSAGWKKFERLWDVIIQGRRLGRTLPVLEGVLSGMGRVRPNGAPGATGDDAGAPPAPVSLTASRPRRPVGPVDAPGRDGVEVGAGRSSWRCAGGRPTLEPEPCQARAVITVRLGGPDEFRAGVAVWRAAHHARIGGPLAASHEMRVRSYEDAEGFFFVAAEDAGEVVGGVIGMQARADDGRGAPERGLCHVSMVFVAPDRWRQGIGARLLEALMAEAGSRGYDRVQLWTDADNAGAQALFERAGLRRTGREKVDDAGTPTVHYAGSL